MRKFSACAWARVQSRLSAAAAAAVLFSSCLREVGILSSLKTRLLIGLVIFLRIMGSGTMESQHGERSIGGSWRRTQLRRRIERSARLQFVSERIASNTAKP